MRTGRFIVALDTFAATAQVARAGARFYTVPRICAVKTMLDRRGSHLAGDVPTIGR
jgi:hypothetical protein